MPIFLILLFITNLAFGEGRIFDNAGILNTQTVIELESEIQSVESATSAEIAVVSTSSLAGQSIEDYAEREFNRLGVGKRETNNGVLLLVAPNDRRVRIEVGFGLESLISDSRAGEVLDRYVIPQFRTGQVERGVVEGTREILRILRSNPKAAIGSTGMLPLYMSWARKNRMNLLWGGILLATALTVVGFIAGARRSYGTLSFICVVAGLAIILIFTGSQLLLSNRSVKGFLAPSLISVGGLFFNLRRYLRFRPHRCERCGTYLSLLNDQREDQHLSAVQKLEESLGSVDYDVWSCPACLAKDVDAHVAWFSGFQSCPECKHRTYSEKRAVIRAATTLSTGLIRITGECRSCWFKAERTEAIPRQSTSSSRSYGSSGGGSSRGFGGGSSGGGGASRSW